MRSPHARVHDQEDSGGRGGAGSPHGGRAGEVRHRAGRGLDGKGAVAAARDPGGAGEPPPARAAPT